MDKTAARMPGAAPPYQKVIAIADIANEVNGCGRWKYINIRARANAAATEARANP
jgi:hypothetical protein